MKKILISILLLNSLWLSSCSESSQINDSTPNIDVIEKEASNGHVLSQYNLGILYLQGIGVAKDINKAIYWITKAAEAGDSDAQYNLGVIYSEKEYESFNNFEKSYYWYKKSTEKNNKMALNNLANFYREGTGNIQRNYSEAVRLYKLSADQGYAPAQVNLGSMYLNGYGVSVSITKALELYNMAAQQGDADG